MSEDGLAKAKTMFFRYQGNFFYMSRDGEYEEYKKYNIPKEQELIWKDELVMQWYNKLSFKDTVAFQNLAAIAENYEDYSIVERLIKFVADNLNEGDSLIKLVYAEILLNIACPKELLNAKLETVTDLLNYVKNNDITIDSGWIKKGFAELPNKDYVLNRLKNDLKRTMEIKEMYE
ncbi:MAG: hypothetical protein GX348_03570 [Veillonellaceae bacterium]|nr:hypothetical protein [Veillonellaceae bacterium]